jgi:hypothetical protein
MVALYVTSSEPYSGKTLTCLVLGMRWQREGRRVGYFKPLGLAPISVEGQTTDEDAHFVAQQLGLTTAPADLCPVILTREVCHANQEELRNRVREAYSRASAEKEIMLVGALGPVLSRGAMVGLDQPKLAELLDLKVLLVGRCQSFLDADSIIASARALGDRVVGVILNRVPAQREDEIWDDVVPCLETLGVAVLGLLPDDPVLQSVSVRELVEALGGELLCGEASLEYLVENFVVGAMGVDRALRYFRRTPRKCVITGGDRSDIQLAALETPTRCLILTGHLRPSPQVLARAQELQVPVILVRDDTLSTVSTIDEMLGRLRVRERRKIDHAIDQFEGRLDLEKLDAALGLT